MNQPILRKKPRRLGNPTIHDVSKMTKGLVLPSVRIRGILLGLMLMISSCSGSQNRDEQKNQRPKITSEELIEANRNLVNQEQEKIKEYVKEQELEMEKTGTGLWYQITENGNGDLIQTGDVVTFDYTIRLLDGTLCYDSDNSGPKSFKVGHGDVESGLQQGILRLRNGAEGKFIMPPHLAHGLVGDDDRIPARAIIVYDIEILDVKDSR